MKIGDWRLEIGSEAEGGVEEGGGGIEGGVDRGLEFDWQGAEARGHADQEQRQGAGREIEGGEAIDGCEGRELFAAAVDAVEFELGAGAGELGGGDFVGIGMVGLALFEDGGDAALVVMVDPHGESLGKYEVGSMKYESLV